MSLRWVPKSAENTERSHFHISGVISRTRKAMLGKTKKITCLLVLRGQTVKNRFESELELNQSECKLTQMHEKRDHSLTALTDLC